MTSEEIIEIGVQAGMNPAIMTLYGNFKLLKNFATLVAEKERPWVGLTDEEIHEIAWPNGNETLQAIIKHSILQAEQLLKDKNT